MCTRTGPQRDIPFCGWKIVSPGSYYLACARRYVLPLRSNRALVNCPHVLPRFQVLHVYLGYLVFVVMLIQTTIGMLKYYFFKPGWAKSHNTIGLAVWIIGCLNIFVAGCFWASTSYGPINQYASALCMVGTIVMALYVRMKSKGHLSTHTTIGISGNLELYDRIPNIEDGD